MKKLYKVLILALAAVSCSLEENTDALSTPDNFFRKYSECQSVVNGCYTPIKSIYTAPFFMATECASDIMWIASGTLDAQLDISPVKPRFGATVWDQCYQGVRKCNFAVEGIENSQALTDEQRVNLLCEVKALRGLYYWLLTSFFGDVPFYMEPVLDNADLERVAVLPRMSADSTRAALVRDLKAIAPLATQTRTSDNDGARLGASMAYMLIAEMAAWNKDWDSVVEAVDHLEDIYGDLSKYDLTENTLWRNKNTPESIFEVQHTYVEGGLNYTSNVACVTTPPRKHDDVYDGIQITELGSEATTWQSAQPCVYFSQGLQPRMGADRRKDINYAWAYDGEIFSSLKNATRPWMGPKFWCPGMKTSSDSNNYKVFRYAGALLLKAEALCELGSNAESVRYLNMTRNRAGLGDYVFRTNVRLQEEIRLERARELFGEFQRKFDLVRWGIWYKSVVEYCDYVTLLNNVLPCHRYYPIPDTQVVYSKYNLDNNDYAQYGM